MTRLRPVLFVFGLPAIAMVTVILSALVAFGISVYGLVLAFSAHVGLGFLALFLEPSPFIIGFVELVWGYNIPEHVLTILRS